MEENQTKICPNCKRDIPVDNFVIHSVHCARNIRVCPVCKEPVPASELSDHHEKMHKLLPCKKCGEAVCGADLEDHIRDSCAHTAAACRHCQLELPRKEMPAHESYCGSRTEPCPDCGEYVMIKYRQIHLDSNHGFLKLDDEPAAVIRNEGSSSNNSILRAVLNGSATANTSSSSSSRPNPVTQKTESCTKNIDVTKPKITPPSSSGQRSSEKDHVDITVPDRWFRSNMSGNGLCSRPQLSSLLSENRRLDPFNMPGTSSSLTSSSSSASASSPSSSLNQVTPSRSLGINNNIEPRKNSVMKRTNDQPQINTSVEAANKVDKNIANQNRGAIKKRQAPRPPANRSQPSSNDLAYWSAVSRSQDEERARNEQTAQNLARGLPPVLNPAAKLEKLRKLDALHNREFNDEPQRKPKQSKPNIKFEDFSNMTPMTNEEFMNRFKKLKLKNENRDGERQGRADSKKEDRFNEIKRDLRELRRGLNEVTAPYNAGAASNVSPEPERHPNPRFSEAEGARGASPSGLGPNDDMDVELPCEFCAAPVPANQLVLHQTGCRPDLVQYGRSSSPRDTTTAEGYAAPEPEDDPVIPCEFCTLSLPVYLVAAHQMTCSMLRNRDDSIEMFD